MNQKAKVFSLIALSGAMLFSFTVFGKAISDSISTRAANNSNGIIDNSIIFDQPSIAVPNIANRYSSAGTNGTGLVLYLISDYKNSNYGPGGSLINLPTGSTNGMAFYVSEYADGKIPNSSDNSYYRFQNVDSVSFTTSSSLNKPIGKCTNAPSSRAVNQTEREDISLVNNIQYFDNPLGRAIRFSDVYSLLGGPITKISYHYICNNEYIDQMFEVTKSCNPDGGTIMLLSDSQLYDGEECSFTFTPKADTDLTLDHFYIVDHSEIEIKTRVNQFGKTQYYFTMPTFNVTICALFNEAQKYHLTSNNPEHGSVVISTSEYKAGATASFDVIPDSGYIIDSVLSSPSCSFNIQGNTYSFIMPASDVTLDASFSQITYDVLISSLHGVVNLQKSKFSENEIVSFSITPDTDYTINSVTTQPSKVISEVDGIYSFSMPAENTTIVVSYNSVIPVTKYTVSAGETENGTINLPVQLQYKAGETVNFSVSPNDGYEIDTVTIKDSLANLVDEGEGNYSFEMPESDVEINATFKAQSSARIYSGSSGTSPSFNRFYFTLTINEDYTGLYYLEMLTPAGALTSYNQYFTWLNGTVGKIEITSDKNKTSTLCKSGKCNLWYNSTLDVPGSFKNVITLTDDSASFYGRTHNDERESSSQWLTLTLQ